MANEYDQKKYGYGKRPLWQWIVLYVVIGGVLYGLVYYFFFANKGGYSYSPTNTTYGTQTQTRPAPQNSNTTVSNQPTQPAPSPRPVAPPAPKSVSAAISNFAFSPSQITVKAGTKVTWTNKDSVAHTVTSNSGAFDSGALNPGASYSFVFSTRGTYSYHCAFHPSMTATVVVTQ